MPACLPTLISASLQASRMARSTRGAGSRHRLHRTLDLQPATGVLIGQRLDRMAGATGAGWTVPPVRPRAAGLVEGQRPDGGEIPVPPAPDRLERLQRAVVEQPQLAGALLFDGDTRPRRPRRTGPPRAGTPIADLADEQLTHGEARCHADAVDDTIGRTCSKGQAGHADEACGADVREDGPVAEGLARHRVGGKLQGAQLIHVVRSLSTRLARPAVRSVTAAAASMRWPRGEEAIVVATYGAGEPGRLRQGRTQLGHGRGAASVAPSTSDQRGHAGGQSGPAPGHEQREDGSVRLGALVGERRRCGGIGEVRANPGRRPSR